MSAKQRESERCTRQVLVPMSEDMRERMERISRDESISLSEVARRGIALYLQSVTESRNER